MARRRSRRMGLAVGPGGVVRPRVALPEDAGQPSPDDSVTLMESLDNLTPAMRQLVHEYGAAIVGAMLDDGYQRAGELEDILVGWRAKRQDQWLNTNHITPRFVTKMEESLKGRRWR